MESRMKLEESISNFYYDMTVAELRLMGQQGSAISYNSVLYLDLISYLERHGGCTVSCLAKVLHVSVPAVTMKVQGLVREGLVEKRRDEMDRRKQYIVCNKAVQQVLADYDRPFGRAVRQIEDQFTEAEIQQFIHFLSTLSAAYQKELNI